jgi:hypothetical protein
MPSDSYINNQVSRTSSRWDGANAMPLPLGQELIERGLITAEILDQALELQNSEGKGRLIGEILVDQGLVDEASVMEVVADAYGLPFVGLLDWPMRRSSIVCLVNSSRSTGSCRCFECGEF